MLADANLNKRDYMTHKDFVKAVALARKPDFEAIPYLSLSCFQDCALDNKRRLVTLYEVASLIVGHCQALDGTWLHSEEAPIEAWSKRFDLVG